MSATLGNITGPGASGTFNHIHNSGTGGLLVVCEQFSSPIAGTPTYAGITMTQLLAYNGATCSHNISYLVNPPTGSNSLVANNSSTNIAISFTGANYPINLSTTQGSISTATATGTITPQLANSIPMGVLTTVQNLAVASWTTPFSGSDTWTSGPQKLYHGAIGSSGMSGLNSVTATSAGAWQNPILTLLEVPSSSSIDAIYII